VSFDHGHHLIEAMLFQIFIGDPEQELANVALRPGHAFA
jgi:hypothetical protein